MTRLLKVQGFSCVLFSWYHIESFSANYRQYHSAERLFFRYRAIILSKWPVCVTPPATFFFWLVLSCMSPKGACAQTFRIQHSYMYTKIVDSILRFRRPLLFFFSCYVEGPWHVSGIGGGGDCWFCHQTEGRYQKFHARLWQAKKKTPYCRRGDSPIFLSSRKKSDRNMLSRTIRRSRRRGTFIFFEFFFFFSPSRRAVNFKLTDVRSLRKNEQRKVY
jgi:hypothetical protein